MTYGMPKLAIFAALAACLGMPAQSVGKPIKAVVTSAPKRIIVEPNDFICVSVKVSQELWPDSLDKPNGTGLSSWLVNSLRKKFRENGKLGDATRFRTNENDIDPMCNALSSVYINAKYDIEDKDIIYRKSEILLGNVRYELSNKKKISDEVSSGRVVVLHGQSDVKKLVFSDVEIMANEIFERFLIAK